MKAQYATLELCSGGGAFEATPNPRLQLDLGALRRRLEDAQIGVTDARVMLIARTEPEATISRDGRIVLKTKDRKAAEETLWRLLALAGFDRVKAGAPPSR